MSRRHHSVLCLSVSLLTLGLCLPSTAAAQGDEEAVIEEVIVTAQKRSENVQDVPMTVEVISGKTLEKNNLSKFEDVKLLSPGLELNSIESGQKVIQLRGVQFTPNSNAEAPVQVYLNDATIPAVVAFRSIFDLSQLEVLRGAQGSLRGRTSPSGAITLETRRPDMDEYEGFLQTEFTDIDQRHITGAVSLPLIPGVLSMRVAGDLNYAPSATEVKNITNGKENGNRSRAGRITLDWRPNDKLEMGLMFQRLVDQNTTYGAFYSLPQCNPINTPPAGETVCTNNGLNNAVYPPLPPHIGIDDRTALAAGPSHANAQQSIYQFRSSYDLGDSRLFFTAAHIDAVQEVLNDNDVTNFRPGYRFVGETYLSTAPFKQDSAELRWQSTDDDRWQYMYGLFYSKNATNGSLYTDVGYLAPSTIGGVPAAYQYAPGPNSLNPLYVLRTSLPYDQGTESYSAFTAHSFQVTERDKISLAVRYQNTEVTQTAPITVGALHARLFAVGSLPFIDTDTATPGTQAVTTCEAIPAARFGGPVVTDTVGGQCALRAVAATTTSFPASYEALTYKALTGSASWTHAFSDQINGYVSYSRSHRPGGVTIGIPTSLPPELLAFDEETSNAFEVGLKSTLLDGRLRLNGDLFYQKFKNYINRASDIAVRDTTRACDPTNSTFTRNFTSRPDPTGVLPNTYADTPQGIAAAGLDPRNCVANAQGLTFNGDAVVKGAEMQIDFRATPRLRLGLNAAYTKAEYVDAFAPCSDPDGNGIAGNQSPLNLPRQVATGQSAQLCDRDGTRLSATTPPWSATFTGEYTQPLLGMEWYGRVIYQYKPSTRNTETDRPIEDVNLVNLYTGFRPEAGDWEVQLFVKNALDEVAKTTGIAQILTGVGNEPTGYGSVNYTPGREIGVSLRYAFSG